MYIYVYIVICVSIINLTFCLSGRRVAIGDIREVFLKKNCLQILQLATATGSMRRGSGGIGYLQGIQAEKDVISVSDPH